LVGANRLGFDAFFVRVNVAIGLLLAVSVGSLGAHTTRLNDDTYFAAIRDVLWVEA
jgi:hypothetical protein